MSVKKEYRETETGDLYVIRYEDCGSTWRMYAEERPENRFTRNSLKDHLLAGDQICVDRDKFNPRTFEEAAAVAYLWMQGFSQYIRCGVFPVTGGRVNV